MNVLLCNCKDRQGNTKQSYISERQAEEQKIIAEDREVYLKVYKCFKNKSCWHLTKCSRNLISNYSLSYNNHLQPKKKTLKNSLGNSISEKLLNELKSQLRT